MSSVRNRKPEPEPEPAFSGTDTLVEQVEKIGHSIKDALTVDWDQLPVWLQDNEFILTGHRPATASFKKSFASLGYIHNESVNIYSHCIGAIGFSIAAWLIYTMIRPRYESAAVSDVAVFGCFFVGAALCLGMSATYHATHNHSLIVARMGNKLDYVGIILLITGSFIPTIYYGFYCHPHLRETYWLMVRR